MPDTVVIIFPTIMSGTVVRWYRNEVAAERGDEMLSAGREGVLVHGYLHEVPEVVLALAQDVHRGLKADRNFPVADLATHRKGLFGGGIEPIERSDTP